MCWGDGWSPGGYPDSPPLSGQQPFLAVHVGAVVLEFCGQELSLVDWVPQSVLPSASQLGHGAIMCSTAGPVVSPGEVGCARGSHWLLLGCQ